MAVSEALRAGILAHLPEEVRGKAEATLAELEANGMRQADYSRAQDALRAEQEKANALYASNKEWFEANQPRLAELDALKSEITAGTLIRADGTTRRAEGAPAGLTESDVVKKIDEFGRDAVGVIAEVQNLSNTHFAQFGEPLDTRVLFTHPKAQQIGIRGVYNEIFADKLKARSDAAIKAAEDKIRADERTKTLAEINGRAIPQYPASGSEASTLDALDAAARTGQPPKIASVDDMAAEYGRLAAQRSQPATR